MEKINDAHLVISVCVQQREFLHMTLTNFILSLVNLLLNLNSLIIPSSDFSGVIDYNLYHIFIQLWYLDNIEVQTLQTQL